MITFGSINFETEISTFGGLTNFTYERLLPDREFARSEDRWPICARLPSSRREQISLCLQ